jgi:single-strand DNA-binding protein
MINKVTLIGNLGRDPELRTLESGATVASFSLATNEAYKDKAGEWQNLTEWHNIVVWRESADRAAAQLKKGMMVYVEGKITSRKYTDKDGVEKSITDIVASSFRLLEKREKSDYGGGNFMPNEEPASMAARNNGGGGGAPTQNMGSNEPPATGDDLPF